MRGFNATRALLAQRGTPRQRLSPNVTHPLPAPKKMEGAGEDFRPPWVYIGTRLVSFAIIPAVGIYSVFFYDFGEREHIFQPIRRWAADGINGFFTLSPAEQRLVLQESQASPSTDVSQPTA